MIVSIRSQVIYINVTKSAQDFSELSESIVPRLQHTAALPGVKKCYVILTTHDYPSCNQSRSSSRSHVMKSPAGKPVGIREQAGSSAGLKTIREKKAPGDLP